MKKFGHFELGWHDARETGGKGGPKLNSNNDGQISNVIEKINIRNMDNALSNGHQMDLRRKKNTRFSQLWLSQTRTRQKQIPGYQSPKHDDTKKNRIFHPMSKQYQFLCIRALFSDFYLELWCLCVCVHSAIVEYRFIFIRLVMMMMKTNVVLFSNFLFSPFTQDCIVCIIANIGQCSNWQTFPF